MRAIDSRKQTAFNRVAFFNCINNQYRGETMEKKYELDEITLRKAENGFVVRCSKKLTKEARAEQGNKTKGNEVSPEYYQSEEYVAETKESALKRISKELDEYAGKPKKKEETSDENYQSGGLGFR